MDIDRNSLDIDRGLSGYSSMAFWILIGSGVGLDRNLYG